MTLLRRSALSALTLPLLLALLLLPSLAGATLVTIDFEIGDYDPTITDPTGEFHGPYDWLEGGVRVAGFWAQNVGQPDGALVQGHTHRAKNPSHPGGGRYAEYTHAFTNDLQGLVISLESGASFDLVSIDYDIAWTEIPSDPILQRLPWSFGAADPRIAIAYGFDPSQADFESQWATFSALNDPDPYASDWHTLSLAGAGFTNVTSIWISQTAAQTYLDKIVIDVHGGTMPVPEPSVALLVGLGLGVLASRGRSRV